MRDVIKLLYPGTHLKRWVALLFVGLLALSLGFAYLLVEVYRTVPLPQEAGPATLQFLPRIVRAALFVAIGVVVASVGFWRLNKSVLDTVSPSGGNLVD